jgi:hypothetical protein
MSSRLFQLVFDGFKAGAEGVVRRLAKDRLLAGLGRDMAGAAIIELCGRIETEEVGQRLLVRRPGVGERGRQEQ